MSRRWALVLGSSSGFGAAAARAFAEAGYDIIGVHLDRRATLPQAEAVVADVRAAGRLCHFFNVNAASDEGRDEVLDATAALFDAEGGRVHVLLHSLAFGSLLPFVPQEGERGLRPRQLTMTLEVMANSLVWWARDLAARGLLACGGRVFAMTSSGSRIAIPAYGAVSGAKAALEAYIRQLAVELAPLEVTANAVLAGVTDTPALRRIPGHERLMERALSNHPRGRLTTPEDVAAALVALSTPGTGWMTGNVLLIDGGENVAG
ncbi:MAG: SDR family oxidoreductase [Alphaproteobacteria bacterium]|nr:SDR family oxidoreductase [Alphaproteobacteria bacterium]